MNRLGTALGILSGLLISALGWIILDAASIFSRRAHWSASDWEDKPFSVTIWSDLTNEYFPHRVAIGAIGALNGALGARNGLRSDARELGPVWWVPLLLLLYPVVEFIRYPNAGDIWGGAFVVAIFMAPFVWMAGRVGQEIGAACRRFADKSTH